MWETERAGPAAVLIVHGRATEVYCLTRATTATKPVSPSRRGVACNAHVAEPVTLLVSKRLQTAGGGCVDAVDRPVLARYDGCLGGFL